MKSDGWLKQIRGGEGGYSKENEDAEVSKGQGQKETERQKDDGIHQTQMGCGGRTTETKDEVWSWNCLRERMDGTREERWQGEGNNEGMRRKEKRE